MQYDTEDKRLGGGIITICVFHIIGFVITILGTILAFSMKNNLKGDVSDWSEKTSI
ncbi:hypothetical protein NNC19_21460 [Clostridium sp. SHJSY1]|uniref:hypothetical protein n=1 Tax=Clostridium sp. SHJSY1 TaxID=2942483 RepID=UPI002875D161|nr:hypothetical protein [Clostridium sp. SHJSY1]MDS0528259.1 hypothetical protein [Clostridium sp. SHJSY1]